MDLDGFLTIVNSICSFLTISGGIVNGMAKYWSSLHYQNTIIHTIGTGGHIQWTIQCDDCDCCFPCNATNIICKAIAENDDSLSNVVAEDYKLVSEVLRKIEQQERQDIIIPTNPIRLLKYLSGLINSPFLLNYFIEVNGDQTKIARIFTIGAPLFQEVGLVTLSVSNYAILNLALKLNFFVDPSRFIGYVNRTLFPNLCILWGSSIAIASFYYSSKLVDPIEQFFLISVMLVRTFGGNFDSSCLLDLRSVFSAGIVLWFFVQNLIWAVKGVNVLDPSVGLWKPF
jgi:hypothetical protein